ARDTRGRDGPGPGPGARRRGRAGASGRAPGDEKEYGPLATDHLRAPCLGLCERAPAALAIRAGDPVRTAVSAPATTPAALLAANSPDSAPEEPPAESAVPQSAEPQAAVPPASVPPASVPQAGRSQLTLLGRIGVVDPASLDDYRAHGGYTALRRAFALGPAGVIREVVDSGLVGRGGAAFPTGCTWPAAASRPDRPHYLVCAAGDSGPGAFKDRVLLEGDPYALVEAMTIAGYAIGAHQGYLYVRGEYPRALSRVRHAVERARARGLLGDDVLGRGHAFDIEIRRGAGAYVCGEETALLNSIEGRRGEPRSGPPFPAEKGLFGRPTVVNDVETLLDVLPLLTTGRPAGTGLFCVSGSVDRPGLYEFPSGVTLGDLLKKAGLRKNLSAVLLGGAAGRFVRPDEPDLHLPLTHEGAVTAFDDTVPLPRLLLRIAQFFREESCGLCVPCRIGTVRQEEALQRLMEHPNAAADIPLLRDVGRTMRDASLCGLGQNAWNAVESAVDRLGVYA
ncbi:NADH-ubiquinone oxidoreductase-F iron-sulfur binding region domain-containing protein, partial [Streptomyces sp. NPDC047072]|uniref:NADH-ubiquinone oxidoreductase-F iron-sulfur binding region domain-containing protein n=1 Tax=Streptomyces sp. NPDC047072 TaxID=3154809 RepID=UPI0033E3BD66